jgi:hypothetical protein
MVINDFSYFTNRDFEEMRTSRNKSRIYIYV